MPLLKNSTQCCLFMLLLSAPLALSQSANKPAGGEADDKTLDLVREVRKSDYDPVLGRESTPALQEAFEMATDAATKGNIASVLVTLGQKDEVYWRVLSKRAQEIVDSQAPYPLVYDASGKSIRGAISPEFLEWIKTNNLPKDQAYMEQMGQFPADLFLMGTTGDARGLPILRKGLLSKNYGVRAMAAMGLAVLQDNDSIPLIIKSARQAPAEIQWFVAMALVSFDDPKARAASDELILDKALLADLRQRVKEKGPRGEW